MLAARNALVASTPAPVAPTFDIVGNNFVGATTSGTAVPLNITAAAGADVFLLLTGFQGFGITASPTCGGVSMGSPVDSYGWSTLYRIPNAGTGASVTVSFTPNVSSLYGATAVVFSVKNVHAATYTSGGSGAGNGDTCSTGSVTCPTNGLIIGITFFYATGPKYPDTESGGTPAWNGGNGYAPSTALNWAATTTTFSGFQANGGYYGYFTATLT